MPMSWRSSYTSSNGYGYRVATGNCALLRECRGYLNKEPGYVCEAIEPVGSSSCIANVKMADGRQADFEKGFCQVKGFWGLEGRYVRFPHDVLDKAECDHCKCIPKDIYYLRCLKHQLCLACKCYCRGYYCNKCDVHTSPGELLVVPRSINYEARHLRGLCPFCDVEMRLEWMEGHIWIMHQDNVSIVEPKTHQTKNEDMAMDVDETGDGKIWDHDLGQIPEQTRWSSKHSPFFEAAAESNSSSELSQPIAEMFKCHLCKNNVLKNNLKKHVLKCAELMFPEDHESMFKEESVDQEAMNCPKHRSECPKIERKCSDCGANVLHENIQNHQEVECQKREALCDACNSAMSYDELGEHDEQCLEKPVVCEDCEGEVLRKDKSKHASECPMRVVGCENCEGFYAYSLEKEHREQCEKKELACEYCKLELKGDDEKNAHLQICEDVFIECAFKEFGCDKKAPRKQMQEHNRDPHNALLHQVILGLEERIENLERPLNALVKKLCNSDLVRTSQ